jgi:2-dehydropantoate 2-reductase
MRVASQSRGTRIAVLGAGGVGAYFGLRLARGGAEVHLIARGRHLEALQSRGLSIRSPGGEVNARLPATDDPNEVGPCDYVLFCVKSFDTLDAAKGLPALMDDQTTVVSLQNGVDNEDVIAEELGKPQQVMAGVAYVGSSVVEPGVVEDVGSPIRLVFGEWNGTRAERGVGLLRACKAAGLDAEYSFDIGRELWSKMAFMCAIGGITAASRMPIGEFRTVPSTRKMFQAILAEVAQVGRAEGVDLPVDLVDKYMALADRTSPGNFSSLYKDLVAGNRLELDALHGTIVRRAEKHGISVPACESIYALLLPAAQRAEARWRPI